MWGVVAKTLFGFVGDWAKAREQRKAQQRVLNHAITMKKIDYVREGRISEVEWNNKRSGEGSWKDEYMTIVLSLPMILVFFPPLVPYIREGFAVLETMPDWYKAAVAVMIAAAFGYRKYADWQMNKHYTLPDPLKEQLRKDK